MKKAVLIFLLVIFSKTFVGQTLVRYGNHGISRDEFLTAFQKNNSNVSATEKAYRDYLNLYIRYRLKVQAAYDMRLDTLPGQLSELQNFKSQVVDQYLNDEKSLNQMAKEAFVRSQLDLRISYIFVAVPGNASPADTSKAWQKIQDASKALKNNKDFAETALQYSEDPFVKNNRGDLGFITVFDLPYDVETVAYNTALGKYSPVFRSKGGYIILKKMAEKKAEGRIRAAQILLAFPYQANDAAKQETRRRADSIYQAIRGGADFGELARKFSGDNLSYQLGGVLPEFGIGKYERGFEATAFGLKNDGDVSLPYESAFGYHIIKRIKRIPVPSVADQKTIDEYKEKIKADPRIAVSRKRMTESILKQTGFKEFLPPGNILWQYTDSMLQNKRPPLNSGINDQSVLFEFPDKKILVIDWIVYRKSLRSSPNLTNGKSNEEILEAYKQNVALDYYKQHLDKYNTAFAAQVAEFRDGNLLFEIMQRHIWNYASTDSAGLRKYFESNKQKYWWKPGAEAILFNANNAQTMDKLKNYLGSNIIDWRKKVDSLGGQVQADSGRFELKQLPVSFHFGSAKSGKFTSSQINADKSVQIAYIIREYPTPSARTFEEARGLVINDYQSELENVWIGELKKKYPVVINEVVFRALPIKAKSKNK
jgi:peptidyl-prolyl cis-trans isomerase SurA